MKEVILPITLSLLIVSLAGCSLLPPSTLPTPTAVPASIPPSGYEPQSGDSKLKRDQVFLDVENSSLVTMESYPVQVSVVLNGNLSDPCHQLRVVVSPANAQNQINLDVYTVFDPSVACITVLKPFNATIPLGNYAGGHYTVNVNGQLLGEIDL
jgi:predicted small lipoprotein YifL